MNKLVVLPLISFLIIGCGSDNEGGNPSADLAADKARLGEKLYSDVNLSFDRTQSCATCHNPDHGFIDERTNSASIGQGVSAGSLGDNGISIGDRNAPSAAYAALSPNFYHGVRTRTATQVKNGDYTGFIGGQFWDGREDDLAGQAGGPPTNPDEMGMPDKASVIARIQENEGYISEFEKIFGTDIFNIVDAAYLAMAESIAEFEKTPDFAPFDSKYDRSLTGDYVYPILSKARDGKALFFSSDFTCASCHQLKGLSASEEPFTSFEYHNIGVPENAHLRSFNGVTTVDLGLFNNPAAAQEEHKGKFKVPTLRNVAVTAPYMHNGIFQELETVLHFYEHAKVRARMLTNDTLVNTTINPETGLAFKVAEVNQNIEQDLLGGNDIDLTTERIEDLVCFMMSLTDAKFEHLLDEQKVESCGL